MISNGVNRVVRCGVQHCVQQSLPAIACRLMIKWFIDSELCGIEKIEDKHCKGGIFKPPLQSLSLCLSRKRAQGKSFPSPLLKMFCCFCFLLKQQGQTLSKGLIIAPLSKSVLFLHPTISKANMGSK